MKYAVELFFYFLGAFLVDFLGIAIIYLVISLATCKMRKHLLIIRPIVTFTVMFVLAMIFTSITPLNLLTVTISVAIMTLIDWRKKLVRAKYNDGGT